MNKSRKSYLIALFFLGVIGEMVAQKSDLGEAFSDVRTEFSTPPDQYRPETWFHLIGGNVSASGLSVDLAAVSAAGFRGVQLFHGRGRVWPGVSPQIQTLSSNWDELIAHVGRETEELGLDFTMQNCPGWAMSGGPWITPDVAMRHLIWSDFQLSGGRTFNDSLPLPQPSTEDWRDYREVAVLAFPTPDGGATDLLKPVSVSSNLKDQPWDSLLNGEEVAVELPAADQETWVEVSFANPVNIRSLSIPPIEILMKRRNFDPSSSVSIAAWTGTEWKPVGTRQIPRGNWQDRLPEIPLTLAFPDHAATRFRITFHNDFPMSLAYLRLGSRAVTNDWRGQAGFALRSRDYTDPPAQNTAAYLDPATIIDLTDRFQNGTLNWTPPPGQWTVLRFGNVNTGVKNKPAPPEATGFECDKLSPLGAEAHFAGYIGRLTEKGAPVENSLDGMLIDSWECYTQTWTPTMAKDFAERRSYPLLPWLPALAGYVVKDHHTSERFLRDWRATISDLLVDNYFGRMAELGRERGLKLSFETALGDVSPGDILQYYSKADVPMCEFWQPNDPHFGGFETKPIHPAVSAANVYGKSVIAVEAFTNVDFQWNEHPFVLKHRADQHFALGINHLVFHTYTHNPRQDLVPGTSFGGRIGTPFIRGQTWWDYMPDFTDYLARCQRLLQTGRPVKDVLWYLGDDVDHKPQQRHPFPNGYKFDYVNFDALVNRISVKDGWLVTPEGIRWRVLWLPATTCQGLLPETLAKIKSLLEAGATVIGPPPMRNPSLMGSDVVLNDERARTQVQWEALIGAMWGYDKALSGDRVIGKGRLIWGTEIGIALNKLKISPDVPDTKSLSWAHRQTEDTDIYFLSADRITPFQGTLRFRTSGSPEFWDALTGQVMPVPAFTRVGEYVHVPVNLPAAGSIFVVFRKKGSAALVTSISHNNEPIFDAEVIDDRVDQGLPYPFAGIQPGETLQPWVAPPALSVDWADAGKKAIAWRSGNYEFERADGSTFRRTVNSNQLPLATGWNLSFPGGWDSPKSIDLVNLVSWTKLPDPGARVFSGTATYRNTFTVNELKKDRRYLLDLGRVNNLAEIELNGQNVAKIWAPPFRTDLTPYLKEGKNELTVRVTNTWHNRLSYDAGLPEADRKTWTYNAPPKNAEPEPAGLIGPVVLRVGALVSLK